MAAPELLIRNISEDLVARLRARAKGNGRSLQREVMAILREAAPKTMTHAEARETTARIRTSRVRRTLPDATQMIREDRDHGH